MSELKVVRAEGSPERRGVIIGRAFREQVERSAVFCRGFVARRGLPPSDLERLLAPYLAAAERALPHLVAQLRGIAEGARVPFIDVLCANAFEEIYGVLDIGTPPLEDVLGRREAFRTASDAAQAVERCTDFVLRGPETTILAHNEQWYAATGDAVGVVVDVPDGGGTPIVAPFVAGTLPLAGEAPPVGRPASCR